MTRGQLASTNPIPAPTGGWNARDPLESMAPNDAVRLINFYPEPTNICTRKGFTEHTTGGMGSAEVQTLVELSTASGTRKLVAGANTALYDCSTASANATAITGTTTPTLDKWQHTTFRDTLIMVNGTDQPQQWAGSGNFSDATYTGTGLTDNDLIHVTSYNSRLYFVEKDTASIWYGAVDAITGALTEFDYSSLLRKGGYIMFATPWSRNSGDGVQEVFAVMTNMGEMIVYEGLNPGDSTWSILDRFYLPIPIGRRSFVDVGSDVLILTQEGVIPMSFVIASGGVVGSYAKLSDKIQDAFTSASRDFITNFGWQAIQYPKNHSIYINIPVESSVRSHQYVMNTLTGAWTKFTGMNTSCWSLFNEHIYFGGIDGKVYKADDGKNDNGDSIPVKLKTAFNGTRVPDREKQFVMGRPLILTERGSSLTFDIDVDYANKSISNVASISGSTGPAWDSVGWDTSPWGGENIHSRNWYNISGFGRTAAIVLEADIQGFSFELSGFDIMYRVGGLI